MRASASFSRHDEPTAVLLRRVLRAGPVVAACASPQRVTSQRNSLTAHDDLLTAQADQAQAWFRLYCGLGGGWNADPSLADQLAAQP